MLDVIPGALATVGKKQKVRIAEQARVIKRLLEQGHDWEAAMI